MNKQDYENAALELQRLMQSKFTGDVKTNFILIEYLGRFARDYVLDKYPDAELRYKTIRGRRNHVGIYDTGGVEIDEKENYSKRQHRQQRLGPLIECQNATRISCWIVWRETARAIIKANPHESPELLSSLAAFMAMENIAKGAGPQALSWTTLNGNVMQ